MELGLERGLGVGGKMRALMAFMTVNLDGSKDWKN